jgi:hypothetical protein
MTQDNCEVPLFTNNIHFTCNFMDANSSIVPDALTHLLHHEASTTSPWSSPESLPPSVNFHVIHTGLSYPTSSHHRFSLYFDAVCQRSGQAQRVNVLSWLKIQRDGTKPFKITHIITYRCLSSVQLSRICIPVVDSDKTQTVSILQSISRSRSTPGLLIDNRLMHIANITQCHAHKLDNIGILECEDYYVISAELILWTEASRISTHPQRVTRGGANTLLRPHSLYTTMRYFRLVHIFWYHVPIKGKVKFSLCLTN